MFDSSFDRKTAIGASEAAAILGLSPYETQWDVFLRKTGQAPEFSDSVYTRAGDALEPLIGQLYEERAKERIGDLYPDAVVVDEHVDALSEDEVGKESVKVKKPAPPKKK